MANHVRARKEIIKYLTENGKSTTWQIHNHLKSKYRNSPTINCLGNLLGKNPDVYMVSASKRLNDPNYNCRQQTYWKVR